MAAAMEVDAGEEKPSEKELFLAAESGDADAFSSLAPADLAAALSLRNEDGRSLLHVAAASGHPKVVTALLAAGDEAAASVVNVKDEEGWAPIHSVASSGNAKIIEILLDHGADVDLATDAGRTALHYTASKGRRAIAETLIARRANVNKKDKIMGDSGDEFFYKNFIDTSSDEESDDDMITQAALLIHEYNVAQIPVYQGSLPGRAPALDRKRERGHDMLFHDYFYRKALFTPQQFRRRFRMSRPLFSRIMDGVKVYDDWFIAKVDAVGKVGLSSYQKCTAAIRMLAYGVAGDYVDEYVRMSESSCLDAMYRFCRAVIAVFGEEYLRQPTAEDTARLLSINASRGFPGMLGSIDCMHWPWKNCPFGWQGSFKGHSEGCTVILEAVASHDTWIWHSFFGMAGSHNDINVLQRSPVFDRLAHGQSPDVDFEINGHHYNKGYYLADGIYPPWATLVKTVRHPTSDAESRFAKEQEAARKDVERAFGILQARWAIVRHPARTWSVQTMWEVMTACVIMHNMIVEVERDDSLYDNDWEGQGELVAPQGGPATFQDILHVHHEIRDSTVHNQLQADLIAHMWAHVGHNVANEDNEEN